MTNPIPFIAAVAVFLLVGGCNIAGPAYPEKNGRLHLEKRGCPPELIARLIDGKPLTPAEVAEFQSSGSADVRFLVARHRGLSSEQLDVSIASRDDFTRSGAARNPNLSAEQIERLTADTSHTVHAALAGNPALSDASADADPRDAPARRSVVRAEPELSGTRQEGHRRLG
jgi:hypothetical protein